MMYVSFVLFYEAVKLKLTKEQFMALNANDAYYEHEGTYFAIRLSDDKKKAWIPIAIGNNFKWIWALKKVLKELGVSIASYVCREGSPSHRIAKYYKAVFEPDGTYLDGANALICHIQVSGGRNG